MTEIRDAGRRFACRLAMLLAVCLLAGSMGAALAEEDEGMLDYQLKDDVLYIHDGVEVLGWLPEKLEKETEGLRHSSALEDYLYDGDGAYDVKLREIVLPDTLRYLGESGLYRAQAEQVRLPEGLTRLLSYSLSNAYIDHVALPSRMTELEEASFYGCEGVAFFTVAEENPVMKAEDGVVFSKDGKTLLRYPPMKEGDHYDVPAGVEGIGPYAFENCQKLRSVSLPIGVKTIGRSAFSGCVYLESVAVPLTLREIGICAFYDCIQLSQIVLPEGVQVVCPPDVLDESGDWDPATSVFCNTPKLAAYPEWDQYKVEKWPVGTGDDEVRFREGYGILNPENARALVNIYERPSEKSRIVGQFACGSTVIVNDYQDGWFQVVWRRDCDEGAEEGWVKEEELLYRATGEPLFQIASVRVKNDRVEYMNNGPCVLPYDQPRLPAGQLETLRFEYMEGQWAYVSVWRQDADRSYWSSIHFYPSDLIYTRENTGDNLRFGMVISDDARDRLNLRREPSRESQSIGKYFSGTQVQILGEKGDWYQVRVDFMDGWMMKEFVQEVLKEER